MTGAATGIVVGSDRDVMTHAADGCRGADAKGVGIRVEGHPGAGGDMGDMLGMNPFTLNRLRGLAVARRGRVSMARCAVGTDGITGSCSDRPGGI